MEGIVFHDFDIRPNTWLSMAVDGQPDTDVNRPRSDLSHLWLSCRARRVWKEI